MIEMSIETLVNYCFELELTEEAIKESEEIRKKIELIKTIAEKCNPGCKEYIPFPSGDTLITLPDEFTIRYGHECTLIYNVFKKHYYTKSKYKAKLLEEYKDYCRAN